MHVWNVDWITITQPPTKSQLPYVPDIACQKHATKMCAKGSIVSDEISFRGHFQITLVHTLYDFYLETIL